MVVLSVDAFPTLFDQERYQSQRCDRVGPPPTEEKISAQANKNRQILEITHQGFFRFSRNAREPIFSAIVIFLK
jgi:hypothetical protein